MTNTCIGCHTMNTAKAMTGVARIACNRCARGHYIHFHFATFFISPDYICLDCIDARWLTKELGLPVTNFQLEINSEAMCVN